MYKPIPISQFIPLPFPPWCPYIYSLCLCLYFSFANKIIYTIFSGFCMYSFMYCIFLFLTCCSVAKSCPTLSNRMDCCLLGFPVLHYLPEFAQTHIHWVSDAIQPSHLLSPPSFSCPQSFPASGSFPKSRLFASLFLHSLQYSVFLNYSVKIICLPGKGINVGHNI